MGVRNQGALKSKQVNNLGSRRFHKVIFENRLEIEVQYEHTKKLGDGIKGS